MNTKEFREILRKKKPPKHFSALSIKEVFKEGYESAINEAIFESCFLDDKQPNKPKRIKELADKYVDNNTPSHYQGTIQPIDLINAQNLNFNLGNVVKYVCRAGKKQGENVLSDLKKAQNYINYEIERVTK